MIHRSREIRLNPNGIQTMNQPGFKPVKLKQAYPQAVVRLRMFIVDRQDLTEAFGRAAPLAPGKQRRAVQHLNVRRLRLIINRYC